MSLCTFCSVAIERIWYYIIDFFSINLTRIIIINRKENIANWIEYHERNGIEPVRD